MCPLVAGTIGVLDRVGAADVLTEVKAGADQSAATPLWSFQLIDGGGNDCAETAATLGATSLDLKLVTALTLGSAGGFTGQPTQLAKDTYGRLLSLEAGIIPAGGGGGNDGRD